MYRPGSDWDLEAALYYCGRKGDPCIEDVAFAVCYKTGQNDEEDWEWAIELMDGTTGILTGGCDYTGWDCQASINWKPNVKTPKQIAGERLGVKVEEYSNTGHWRE